MANKSIIDVDTAESITQEDLFYVNSNKSLKQIKNKNLKFDYDTNVINKPSINGVELCGGDGKSLNELGIGSSADIADLRQTKAGAIINSAKGERIAVGDSSDAFFEGLKLFGKSEQVRTKGYQLFDASKIPTKSAGGATVTNNGDGSFTISGSGNLTSAYNYSYVSTHEEMIKLLKVGKLYHAKSSITGPQFVVAIYNMQTSQIVKSLYAIEQTRSMDITSEDLENENYVLNYRFIGTSGDAIKPGTVKPMIYQDGDGTWEPFTGGKPSPSMEYKQDPESSGDGGEINVNVGEENTQHLSIQTPNGLPGIKVDSGGNYTDSNGQQWVCDEMDFGRGKYVQRIKKLTLDGSDDENWSEFTGVNLTKTKRFASAPYAIPAVDKSLVDSCITNRFLYLRNDSDKEHFRLSTSNGVFNQVVLFTNVDTVSDVNALKNWLKANPVEILVPLATPIETDIPEETMNVYRRLYTNFPSTVIQNDSGAGMEVEYVADTKSYIDNKLKELVQAAYGSMANMLSLMPTNVQAEMIENDTNNILNNL